MNPRKRQAIHKVCRNGGNIAPPSILPLLALCLVIISIAPLSAQPHDRETIRLSEGGKTVQPKIEQHRFYAKLGIAAESSDVKSEQYEMPSWVLEEALVAAQNHWLNHIQQTKATSLKREFGLNGLSEAYSCELRNPYKAIGINYIAFSNNMNLYDFITSSHGADNTSYGFGIYYKDDVIGDINVEYRNDRWALGILSMYGPIHRGDLYEPIYGNYPVSKGYVIYRDYFSHAFFVVKDQAFIAAYYISDFVNGKYEPMEPSQYLRERAERQREGLRLRKARELR